MFSFSFRQGLFPCASDGVSFHVCWNMYMLKITTTEKKLKGDQKNKLFTSTLRQFLLKDDLDFGFAFIN